MIEIITQVDDILADQMAGRAGARPCDNAFWSPGIIPPEPITIERLQAWFDRWERRPHDV